MYCTGNCQSCIYRRDVVIETGHTPTSEVQVSVEPELQETNAIAIVEPTEEYIVKKNIFGDLVARSKK